MKHWFTLSIVFALLVNFSACQRKQSLTGNSDNTRYEYELLKDTQVYSTIGDSTIRLADLPAGTRVSTYGPAVEGDYRFVEYNGYNISLYQPRWYATHTYKGERTVTYKPITSYTRYVGVYTVPAANFGYTPSTGVMIHTGPRGGHYYYNSKGNKTYVKTGSFNSSGRSSKGLSSSYRGSSRSSYRSTGGSYRSSRGGYRR